MFDLTLPSSLFCMHVFVILLQYVGTTFARRYDAIFAKLVLSSTRFSRHQKDFLLCNVMNNATMPEQPISVAYLFLFVVISLHFSAIRVAQSTKYDHNVHQS